jgi:hypothetical protein
VRFIAIAAAAALLAMPAAGPAEAGNAPDRASAQQTVTDMSSAKKKKAKARKPREKVEYMRAVPSGLPKAR